MLTVGASSSGKTSDVLSRFKKEIKSGSSSITKTYRLVNRSNFKGQKNA